MRTAHAAPRVTKEELVRQLFAREAALAGRRLTVRETTIRAIDTGIYDTDMYEAKIKAFEPRVAKALRALDERGLPFAGPSGTGDHTYVQRTLWTEADSLFNIEERTKQVRADSVVLLRLVAEHESRWGYQPGLGPPLW